MVKGSLDLLHGLREAVARSGLTVENLDEVIYMDQSPEPTTQVGTSTGNSFDLTELEFGPVYNVRVTARDGSMVESPYSNEIEIQLDPTVPVLINAFVAEATSDGVRLGWDIASDEEMSGFQVYRRVSDTGLETAVNANGLIPADQRGTTDRTAQAGRSYEYTLVVVLAEHGNAVRDGTGPDARHPVDAGAEPPEPV